MFLVVCQFPLYRYPGMFSPLSRIIDSNSGCCVRPLSRLISKISCLTE